MLFSPSVPHLTEILEVLRANPTLAYLFMATVLLAGVSLASGIAHGDFRVLRSRSAVAKVAAGIAAAVAIAHAVDLLAGVLFAGPPGPGWPDGMHRLPLYVLALAYGPSIGVMTGAGFHALGSAGMTPEMSSPVLVIELLVLGWLSIYPSPARLRWAGPVDAGLAYVLAWLTAGLVLLESSGAETTLTGIAQQHTGSLVGLAITVAALALVPPSRYRIWFPETRIHGPGDEEAS